VLLELVVFLEVVDFANTVLEYAVTVVLYFYVFGLVVLLIMCDIIILSTLLLFTFISVTCKLFLIIPLHLHQFLINIVQNKRVIKPQNRLNPLILHLFLLNLRLYQPIPMHLKPSLTTILLTICILGLVMKRICYKIY